jgi:hypothetical protein
LAIAKFVQTRIACRAILQENFVSLITHRNAYNAQIDKGTKKKKKKNHTLGADWENEQETPQQQQLVRISSCH